jgi:Fur family ferric uptake transcriptional regulator
MYTGHVNIIDKYHLIELLLQLDAITMSCFTILKKKGFRLTQPRRIILDYIQDKGNLTTEGIITFVHKKYPHVNKSTVYRTLELLEESGYVFKSESISGTIYHHAEEGHYHHLVCRKCGRTIDCEKDVFEPVERSLREEYGFQISFKHFVIGGLCEECRNNSV